MIVGAHIPNGSANGWEKVYALEALAQGLSQIAVPTILAATSTSHRRSALDPTCCRSAGMITTIHLDGMYKGKDGHIHPRQRWQVAVEAVLTPRSRKDGGWGGRHVASQAGSDFETTHVVHKNSNRCFDHILTSGSVFRARAVRYDHTVREGTNRPSDHSMIVAILESATSE